MGLRAAVVCAAYVFTAAAATADERVVIESGGWQLIGDWSVPDDLERFPAALLLHKAAGARTEYEALAEALASRGIASLRLDLRANGESVNLGRFEQPYREHRALLEGTHDDVDVALRWVSERAEGVAVVGASYSGEAVGVAIRAGGERASAYVMLAPGSFSEESVALVDPSGVPWLFVRTSEESADSVEFIDAVFDAVRSGSESAEIREIPGAGHATDILEEHPSVVDEIADWLAEAMGSAPSPRP